VSSGATGTALCANQYCHGASLTGVANSGPSCDKNTGTGGCHSIPYDPLTVICGACHRVPPDGAAFPNLAGKHAKHATSNKTSCDICHNGASSYVGDHSNGVIDFSFLAAYTPATGLTPTFNPSAKTCSNISCHGGQTTPSWYAGAIDVNTQCGLCHVAGPFAGSPQYNSYYSGHHSSHLGLGAICTDCHDTTNLTVVHFNDLNTPAMTQANQTILDALNYDGYSCQFTCHINNEQHERGMNW
jgi:predicted CxxxxCH...CXXCH cytochrome family protein